MFKPHAWIVIFVCGSNIIFAKIVIDSKRRTVRPLNLHPETTTATTTISSASAAAAAGNLNSGNLNLTESFMQFYQFLCTRLQNGSILHPDNFLERPQQMANTNNTNMTTPLDLVSKPNYIRLLLEFALRLEDTLSRILLSPPLVIPVQAFAVEVKRRVHLLLREASCKLYGLLPPVEARQLQLRYARLLRILQAPLSVTEDSFYRNLLVLREALSFHREVLRYGQQIMELGALRDDPRLSALEQLLNQEIVARTPLESSTSN